MAPVLCMVTDRRRCGGEADLLALVAAAARAGVHLIQVRERDLEARPLTLLVARCVEAVRGTRARVLVNDRLDVALAAGAHGVHLRGDSLPAARLRAAAPAGFVIGRSVHGLAEACAASAAGGLDYLLCGTIFASVSKPGAAAAGEEWLRQLAAAVPLPVLAIGGMTVATAGRAAAAGAAGLAAIGLFADAGAAGMARTVNQVCRAFDTPSGVP